jgi:LuxR family maltose regulon positive regulatory protein
VEGGRPVAAILSDLLKSNLLGKVRPEYVQEILAAFPNLAHAQKESSKLSTAKAQADGEGSVSASSIAGVLPIVESLSARELEVLRLIADGHSNQAIAEKLVITVSAVKKHTGNIYGKLAVNSRTQAVSRARQLGLLAPDM